MKIDHERVQKAFEAYVQNYDPTDPKIQLKIDHTYRVASFCERIARSMDLLEEDVDLAWLLGMLHDLGRFEQVKRYNTFHDAKSVCHAVLSCDILFQEEKIWNYIDEEKEPSDLEKELAISFPSPFEGDTLRIIRSAILHHSDYRLPPYFTKRELMFSNLLRDADKVDIFRVNVETDPQVIYGTTIDEIKASSVSPEVKEAAMEEHAVLRALKKTPADNLIGHISLAFELVFPESREMVKEQGYLEQMLSFPSENEDTKAFLDVLKAKLL